MYSIMLWTIFWLLLVLEIQCDKYTIYYAESSCRRYIDNEVKFNLSSSGHSSSAIIKATPLLYYSFPFNCNITLSVPNNEDAHVLLSVRYISFASGNNCKSYIKIYESKKSYQVCTKADIVKGKTQFTRTDGNDTKFLYHTRFFSGKLYDFRTGFEILATAYTLAPCGKNLDFLCDNGRCISKKLVRDSYDNCGDNSDEYEIHKIPHTIKSSRMPTEKLVGIIIGALLLKVVVSIAVYRIREKCKTAIRTCTTRNQRFYRDGPQPYPEVPPSYPPTSHPPAPGLQNPYICETHQKSEPYPQDGGFVNPQYGQLPPSY